MGADRRVQVYAFLIILSALMIAVIVLGSHGGAYSNGELLPPTPEVDRIAYVDPDGQIWTVRPDGSDQSGVATGEGYFTWPTWSPDGLRLVYSGVVGQGTAAQSVVLFGLNLFSGRLREIHKGEPGLTNLVAAGAPHYVTWSPDGNVLAFVDATPESLRLHIDDLRDDNGPKPVLNGAPLYLAWSPDSRHLLVHHRLEHVMIDVEEGTPSKLDVAADDVAYRVPVWKPSGEAINFVLAEKPGGYALYTSGIDASDMQRVASVPPNPAFLWSPDSSYLAVTRPERVAFFDPLGLRVFQRVELFTGNGTKHPVTIEDNVVAFFWSPDATKLAYVTLAETPGVFRWNILDVADGSRWRLLDFLPSADQLTVFQFFEQFVASHLLWSPDSGSLVFAGRIAGRAVSASAGRQEFNKIIVLGADRSTTAEIIADGVLAFWSPL